MKKFFVFFCVMVMGCMVPSIAPSVYAEGADEDPKLMFYSDKLGNFFVSYTKDNLINAAAGNIGIWQIIQIDYGSRRYIFFRNAKTGYLQLWGVSNAGISRLYGGKSW